MERPVIEYPCTWRFRVIGEEEQQLRAVITAVFGDRPHEVTPGNVSSGGRYRSIEVAAEVLDEADRDGKFQRLAAGDGVRAVV